MGTITCAQKRWGGVQGANNLIFVFVNLSNWDYQVELDEQFQSWAVFNAK